MASCPICGISWAAPVACCPCGFAPAAMDEFVVRLELERRRGVGRQAIGVALCSAVVPFVWLLGVSAAWLLATPLAGGLAVGGVVVFVRGTQMVSRATLRLRAARRVRQLPAARIVSS